MYKCLIKEPQDWVAQIKRQLNLSLKKCKLIQCTFQENTCVNYGSIGT